MESNNRLLSILHIVYGGLILLFAVFATTVIESMLPFLTSGVPEEGQFFMGMALNVIQVLAIFFLIAVPIPSVIGGIALLQGKKWGLTILLISGSLSLFSFPIGTALGVFTIIVYSKNQNQKVDDSN